MSTQPEPECADSAAPLEQKRKLKRTFRKPAHPKSPKAKDPEPAQPQPTPEPTPADPLAHLLPQHRDLILGSAISPGVALERGYRSITVKAHLIQLGFSSKQCSVPTLHLPIHGVTGDVVGHQHRPDTPRVGKTGKPLKYENPKGSGMKIDVPRRVRERLRDPKVRLYITEGIRKADSAASIELACIALLGVWNWRGTNSDGGKTALPEWELIALNGREVFLVFDSDVTSKREVRAALARLKAFLELRGAKVRIVHLPPGENGSKTGLDDFIAQGKTEQDLIALATSELPPPPPKEGPPPFVTPEYRHLSGGIALVQYDEEAGEQLIQVTNFTAQIVAHVIEDDGVTRTQHFEVVMKRLADDGATTREITVLVPAAEYGLMNWVTENAPPGFIVMAGWSNRDHARSAIQQVSGEPEVRTTYTHTGWRKLWDVWAFLHGEGAIGARGCMENVRVRLDGGLVNVVLPPPPTGDELQAAIRASLRLLDLVRDPISVPTLAATYRSVLGGTDFGLHTTGPTGAFKTEFLTLHQQHFGRNFSARGLPGNWSSTANALEAMAFQAKDLVLGVDDFVPPSGSHASSRLQREADRLLRGQGNNSGRQRMNADGTLRATKSPRGLIMSTGEDTPVGHSLRARLVVLEIELGDIASAALKLCQDDGRAGLYSLAMSGFIKYVAERREGLEDRIRQRVAELRATAASTGSGQHRRTPDIVAQLFVGIEHLTEYATQAGAITEAEAAALRERGWTALLSAADQQAAVQEASDPVPQFIALLTSAITSGEAHLCDEHGGPPKPWEPEAVGWRHRKADQTGAIDQWEPRGLRIGWIIDGELLLDPHAAYKVAQRMTDEVSRIPLTPRTLGKRLWDKGHLVSIDAARNRNVVRRVIQGARQEVLHLRLSLLLVEAQTAQSPHAPSTDAADAGRGPFSWAENSTPRSGNGPHERPTEPAAGAATSPDGTFGTDGAPRNTTTSSADDGEQAVVL